MFNVSDLLKLNLRHEGVKCIAKGKFYYRIVDNEKSCYLSELENGAPQIFLSEDLGELVINEDETFGMLVGGVFAYYGIEAEVEGVLKERDGNRYFELVKSIRLKNELGEQSFVV